MLGILGGGQLGRMSALAAARLGIGTVILCPEEDSPASQVAQKTIVAPYNDFTALREFASLVDAITYEFENIPIESVDFLTSLKKSPVYPDKRLLEVSQDRIREKQFLNELGIETTRWQPITKIDDIADTLKEWKSEAFVLKTCRFGYDGKGQFFCRTAHFTDNPDLPAFFEAFKNHDFILEDAVDFADEISVIAARDINGKIAIYGPMLNEHRNHILHKTRFPAPHNKEICARAVHITKTLAQAVGLVGVLTLEFFVTRNGRLLANEIAPRTHNSGHWTIDACAISQFEQHVRTVCGLSVGSSNRHSNATMINLIGEEVLNEERYLSEPNACLHIYGKLSVREGRKMGHVTFLEDKTND